MPDFCTIDNRCLDSWRILISGQFKHRYPWNISCSKIFVSCKIQRMVTNSTQLGYVNNDDKNRYLEKFSKAAVAFESILADCQHGFRSQRSCETKLVQFFHDLVSNLDRALNRNHRQTDVIIMDFAKAFDKVPHRRLLYKLDYYGIRGSTHKWITSWLSGRSQKVVLDGQASDPVPVLSG